MFILAKGHLGGSSFSFSLLFTIVCETDAKSQWLVLLYQQQFNAIIGRFLSIEWIA